MRFRLLSFSLLAIFAAACGGAVRGSGPDDPIDPVNPINPVNPIAPVDAGPRYPIDGSFYTDGGLLDGNLPDGSDGSDGGRRNTCGATQAPNDAIDTTDVTLTGAAFGGNTPDAWKSIGFDLDGLCSTNVSTDVCTPTAGALLSVKADGNGGIDNSFGANIMPFFNSISPDYFASSTVLLKLQNGSGSLILVQTDGVLTIPLTDAKVAMSNGGGTLSAIIPTAAFTTSFNAFAGHLGPVLCESGTQAQFDEQIAQANDILVNGDNYAGTACTGISIGVAFSGTTGPGVAPDPGPDPCAQN